MAVWLKYIDSHERERSAYKLHNISNPLIWKKLLFRWCFCRKISVHQSSINGNGRILSVLRLNSTEKRDGGFYTCQVIIILKRSSCIALKAVFNTENHERNLFTKGKQLILNPHVYMQTNKWIHFHVTPTDSGKREWINHVETWVLFSSEFPTFLLSFTVVLN